MENMMHSENAAQTQLDTGKAKLKPAKLGWNSDQVKEITDALNELQANYALHYQKLRNFHWNVKGSDFFDLHEKFGQQYAEAGINIDAIAERIRLFGETPLSTLQEYLEVSEIKETSADLTSEIMVREIVNDYTKLLKYMNAVVDVSSRNADFGTESMVKTFIKTTEKNHWQFSAFLSR
jgi:starvation-inducible DNA-binding protein